MSKETFRNIFLKNKKANFPPPITNLNTMPEKELKKILYEAIKDIPNNTADHPRASGKTLLMTVDE